MTERDEDRRMQADIEKLLGELTQRAYAGQLKGIAIASVTNLGFACRFAHFDKQRGPLLAAVVLLEHDIVASFEVTDAPPLDGETHHED